MQDIVQGDLDLDEFFEEMQETGMQVRAVLKSQPSRPMVDLLIDGSPPPLPPPSHARARSQSLKQGAKKVAKTSSMGRLKVGEEDVCAQCCLVAYEPLYCLRMPVS
jgi:hypothetical protein